MLNIANHSLKSVWTLALTKHVVWKLSPCLWGSLLVEDKNHTFLPRIPGSWQNWWLWQAVNREVSSGACLFPGMSLCTPCCLRILKVPMSELCTLLYYTILFTVLPTSVAWSSFFSSEILFVKHHVELWTVSANVRCFKITSGFSYSVCVCIVN